MRTHLPLSLLASLGCLSLTHALLETPFGQYVDRCPSSCSSSGPSPSNWTQIHRVGDLARCNQTVLFDLNVQNLVTDPRTQITIRTCSRTGEHNDTSSSRALKAREVSATDLATASISIDNNCGAMAKQVKVTAQAGPGTGFTTVSASDLSSAASQLVSYLQRGASCGSTILFAKSGDAIVGLYSGAEVQKTSAATFVKIFQEQAQNNTRMLQTCKANNTAAQTLGVVAGGMADLGSVQNAVKSWTNGQCVDASGSSPIRGVDLSLLVSAVESNSSSGLHNITIPRSLYTRAECRDIQVVSGDSCASLASRCGISGADFTKYNPAKDLCSTLKPKQYVCCSSGDLPDHSPQPQGDGTCYTYTVQQGDGCWSIADSFGIDQTVIENNNKNTWGWAGCARLQVGQVICLSKGEPPFPNSVENAVCGPQVPGTTKPTDGTKFADLNPCPLNSCCDVWGFCGVTEEFCTPTPADTGAPGTAEPGTNGCISNCGTDIVNNGAAPAEFRRVGYFEAWNGNRPCLNMDASQIDTSDLTHIHFAFATVTTDWQVSIDKEMQDQFDEFKKMDTSAKKIVSFGGWAFSTEPDTFQRFRDATKPQNRDAFANSVVAFLNDNGLDGLDFDWEYPGAPDIPGIPPGTKDEANNYLKFLTIVRGRLPSGASLSIALPASYWYLKQYPVKTMQNYVDYFIYMTYDFHGQWDVDNEFSTPGCKEGNCLRSHINITETKTSLAMITKAGVQANKLLVGISSYGRSFRMSDASCSGPMCHYTGTSTASDAYKGRCTETSGYISNAELKEIVDKKAGDYSLIKSSYDKDSDSDILIYGTEDSADWVAYMSADTKKSRVEWLKGLNMGGATDWAVDLMEFGEDLPDDPNDVCKKEDRTYSTESMPDGTYMDWALMDPENAAATGQQYITIVNLTPHRFKLTSTHSYQMDTFDFGDIPPGRARQNSVHYTEAVKANPVDDNGEAYFDIVGTDKKFVVRASTHIPDDYPRRTIFDLSGMGLGQREYMDPEQEVPVTLVITGSDKYGFITSLSHGPGNWMRGIYDVIKDRTIQHLVMPGTHDSGMSTISNKITPLGNEANTQTQGLNIYDQLRAGARWFDLRVASIHPIPNDGSWAFWVLHVNEETVPVAGGNSGESLDDVIKEINKFTDENPGEVIFFRVKYLLGIRAVPSLGPIYWGQNIADDFFSKLRGVHNRCPKLDTDKKFNMQTASYFMDRNDHKGCVIFLLDGHIGHNDGVTTESVDDGIYDHGKMDFWDDWAQKGDTEEMANVEMNDWKSIGRNVDSTNEKFHIGQWLVSTDILTSGTIGLQNLAILPTNPALYWKGVNNMSPEKWPNVMMVDYIGVVVKDHLSWDTLSADIYTLAIGLNLYMISENCDISKKRSPLLAPPTNLNSAKSSKLLALNRLASTSLTAPTNRIIFANGTVLENPPPTLHPGRVEILRNGTRFSNGTVLTKSIPNPDFKSALF